MAVNLTKVAKKARDYEYILLMMRHAKTEKVSHDGDDAARELTDKGRKQAKHVAKALDGLGLVPDVMAVSGAKRTRQTAERMLKVFGDKPEVTYHKKLYTDGLSEVSSILSAQKKKKKILMIIGHEPTMSEGSLWWSEGSSHALEALEIGLSPASVAVLGAHKPFEQWDIHEADVLAVITAKDCD
ncbi:SixA phosphatase family protein [Alloscardovia macacae]|uniref:Phosphoglycerate mutase n=1 Tax=Alloscardovia macacae TaxID=1160091 RepID=A0A261F5Y1_9BIFI|nr:histidine phosphatase family protein [Alloscardovia macacae]OZG54504.1 phosphoglycerate mutase [Alloscardovia macacae]